MTTTRDPWLEFIERARPAFDAEHATMVDDALAAGEEFEAFEDALQAVVRFGGVTVTRNDVAELRNELWDDDDRLDLANEYLDELERRAA